MSYKNVAAQIPFGGCKLAVHSDYITLKDLPRLGFLAFFIDKSRQGILSLANSKFTRCFTGPDMGFLPEHADILRAHFTKNIVGGKQGPMGPTGTPAGWGTFLAMQQACLAK